MPTKFEPRMAVCWDGDGEYLNYGVVISAGDDMVNVVKIAPLFPWVHCYDEGREEFYRESKDNVRLNDAPPPFGFFCLQNGTESCYAIATVNCPTVFQGRNLALLDPVEEGYPVSEDDFQEILNHPWPEQPEKELVLERPDQGHSDDGAPRRRSAFAVLLQAVSGETVEGEEDEKDAGPDFW